MSEVISLAEARLEREPHIQGTCVCLGCRHEWVGVAPCGVHVGLECPSCELPKGVYKNLIGSSVGDLYLRCECGCEALTAYVRGGLKYVMCMSCGTDLTKSFYDG